MNSLNEFCSAVTFLYYIVTNVPDVVKEENVPVIFTPVIVKCISEAVGVLYFSYVP